MWFAQGLGVCQAVLGRVSWKASRHLQAFVGHKAVVLTAHPQAGCAKPLGGVGGKEQCSQCPRWSGAQRFPSQGAVGVGMLPPPGALGLSDTQLQKLLVPPVSIRSPSDPTSQKSPHPAHVAHAASNPFYRPGR